MAQAEIPRIDGNRVGGMNRFGSNLKPRDKKHTLHRLLQLFLNYRRTLIFAISLSSFSAFFTVAIPYLVGKVFDTFSATTRSVDHQLLNRLLLALLVLYITNALVTSLSHYSILRISQKLVKSLRSQFFAKLQRLPLAFFDTTSSGDTMSRITNDIDMISQSLAQATTQLLESFLTLLGSLSVMFILNVPLSLCIVCCVPFVFLLTNFISHKSRSYFLSQQKNLGQINALVEESIQNLRIIKAFSKEDDIDKEFSQLNSRLCSSGTSAQTYAGLLMPLMNVLNNFTFAIVAIVSGMLCTKEGMLIGTAITFLTYSKRFASPLNQMAGLFNTIQGALAGAERVFDVLDRSEEKTDEKDAIALTHIEGNVVFKQVDFSYDAQKQILFDISFQAQKGQVIALVGETGSGKTTIVNLLTRFYDVDSGSITLDGIPIQHIRRESLRHCFTVVLQESCLLMGTIADTIRYGRPEATDEEVLQAARLAHADHFIQKLPQGYQTMIAPNTQLLSLGERQLLAIARAVLSNSPILILDEATSSVDTKTEKEIQIALTTLMAGRTSFLIAHRLSTIKEADQILVISQGRICEMGNHETLMAQKGQYYEMVQSQGAW
ncbi:ABC transporter ATP-binding protein [uncultured Sphaerochaeta sp.]|uniref:ABC transporter ATP-binding protein n=1 Tax=uncultured Sphaerochaeta sp. TaxID=886478 RepID=UPI002A0A513F|nr:ABC transporter ATP-binding protein [uncultured Sphaerochaeta sp.]